MAFRNITDDEHLKTHRTKFNKCPQQTGIRNSDISKIRSIVNEAEEHYQVELSSE